MHKLNKEDVVKNVLALTSDLLEKSNKEDSSNLISSFLATSKLDGALPYLAFLKHLQSKDDIIKILSAYNLTILLVNSKEDKLDQEIIISVFETLSSFTETNYQIVSIQLLQELLIIKKFKLIYEKNNFNENFKFLSNLIGLASKSPNSISLQLSYNTLLVTWILSFSASTNYKIIHNYPELIGNLLILSKDSIKLKIVRNSIAILRNFIEIRQGNSNEKFKIIKILLFHDALSTINILKERKFASNGSDEELSSDLAFLFDELNDVVTNKLSSFEEYLTELENPNLISWSSPTHKSTQFWAENSGKFKDSNWKLLKKILEILDSKNTTIPIKIILLSDLQNLIKNLGQDLINFIRTEKSSHYKLLIMGFLENNTKDNELKYEALKTVQLLVGHA